MRVGKQLSETACRNSTKVLEHANQVASTIPRRMEEKGSVFFSPNFLLRKGARQHPKKMCLYVCGSEDNEQIMFDKS